MSRKNSTKWRQSDTSPRITKVLRVLAAVVLIKLLVLLGLFARPQLFELPLLRGLSSRAVVSQVQPTVAPGQDVALDEIGKGQTFQVLGVEEAFAANATAPVPQTLDREALVRKQEELDRREQSLRTLEANLDAKLADLKTLEAKLDAMLKDADKMKDEKLRHLVDVYSNMKAKQAAQVLETLDEDIAVKILAGMRGRQAGEILTNVKAEKAAKLSEALTRMQMPFQ